MKKILLLLLTAGFSLHLLATESEDEGMWLPLYLKQLNEKDMQAKGLKLSADDIYNINHASIKDAIVSFGGFCTGEIVSDQGLVLTNHHCGFSSINKHSTVENDFLKNGFWAKNKTDELPNEGLSVSILSYMENVTDIINAQLKDISSETYRGIRRQTIIDSIVAARKAGNDLRIQIKSYFKGNEYYLLAYEVYKDVRLVGAPPQAIGKFGGETDNWMWPRHTGDFSVFRIYMSPNGKPATYNPANVPYKPKHFFPISLKGVKPGQYAMILGFPGTTERYMTSYDLSADDSVYNPLKLEAFKTQLDIMRKDMANDRKVALAVASDFASKSNTYKKIQGVQRQLNSSDIIVSFRQHEKEYTEWVNKDALRKARYGEVLNNIKKAHKERKEIEPVLLLTVYGFFNSPLIKYSNLYQAFDKKLTEPQVDSIAYSIKEKVNAYFKSPAFNTDKKIFRDELSLFLNRTPLEKMPDVFKNIIENFNDKTNEKIAANFTEKLYKKSILLDKYQVNKFLSNPNTYLQKLNNDPLYKFTTALYTYYYKNLFSRYNEIVQTLDENHKLYIKSLREWQPDKKFYPDANSTLRLTYGQVASYTPRDAVQYKYYTTFDGVLDKFDPKDDEFNIPQKQLDLFRKKNFGRYAQNDTLHLCFLTDTDITGGNSGSPVLDEKGRLMGIAFDGNWESMIGDLYVNPAYNRTISVDIRYVLWVIDIYADAKNLISEMKIEER